MSPLVCDLFLWYFTERGTTGHIIKPNQVTKKKKPESSMCVSWNNQDCQEYLPDSRSGTGESQPDIKDPICSKPFNQST